MKNFDITKLLLQNESETLEFKSSFGKESIVAFANKKGGNLLIGVKNNGEISGVDINSETLQNYFNQIKNSTEPSIIVEINQIEIEKKNIIVISIDEFPIKPFNYKGKYYKRVRNSNHLSTPTGISNLHLQSLQFSWDAYEYPKENLSALNIIKIKSFIKLLNSTGRFYTEESEIDTM